MNYIKFLFGRKWWGFTLIFLFLNIAGIWAMFEDPTNHYFVITGLLILDGLLAIFSWNEYRLKYPKK